MTDVVETYTPAQVRELLVRLATVQAENRRRGIAAAGAVLSDGDRDVVGRYLERVVEITEAHAERAERARAVAEAAATPSG